MPNFPTELNRERLVAAYQKTRRDLLNERETAGHWIGELAVSALSTATAVSALSVVQRHAPAGQINHTPLIRSGIHWLAAHQNDDGGWGDTTRSLSNIATTMLVRAAFRLAADAVDELQADRDHHNRLLDRAVEYIDRQDGLAALRRRYGKDKTFAVPILANCAIAGLVPWKEVAPLPFEAACAPQGFYRFLRLPVVSYAIPALVAIGQARFHHLPPKNPFVRIVRRAAVAPSLRVLRKMQPHSGGYLEATPLTSFVVISLASSGQVDHPVVQSGVRFLCESFRPEEDSKKRPCGSWPIDTNLATWNTTLAAGALAGGGEDIRQLNCLDWILSCQHRQRHPFTGADPGGWGWSNLSGAVPDADDTPGALLALDAWRRSLKSDSRLDSNTVSKTLSRIQEAAHQGVVWLLNLQNRDGGWPTFCRGWGKLPFDRSGDDLTAHAMRALHAWRDPAGDIDAQAPHLRRRMDRAIERGFRFLERRQHDDGSWIPLWFGNQYHPEEINPVYGTSKVLMAYRDLGQTDTPAALRGLQWLRKSQHPDGGWGGGPTTMGRNSSSQCAVNHTSSVEETALAVEALLAMESPQRNLESTPELRRGLMWLAGAVETNLHRECSPIGFYFAKLWYYEKLYPLIFTTSALGRAARQLVGERFLAAECSRPTHPLTPSS